MLQYQYRTFYIHTRLNDLDLRIVDVLFRLSTNSIYAVVRRDAQTQLFSLLAHYPYSTSVIVPGIVDLLRAYNDETDATVKSAKHDQLKVKKLFNIYSIVICHINGHFKFQTLSENQKSV